ncbi:cytochrome c oxidase accessory protein CcoG [Marinobacterium mangrovicola]|uniref:Cytochrome c oxidase accessory protein FixG n=1 Tax=Marinobacterium mangrovicola TaxID=1476959 RepID=A0A4R1GL38_9GAMM|nr:cytochrome c oxidase accessory protein CcoG [Marinobacterium mangrovicola]TCK09144.1 cytochrome c oxidase accessory protein FixG [Marinobacterium mangrovicola]
MEKIPVVQDYTPPFARDGKFHVRLTKGRFQNLRRLSSWPMLALFFGLVWVQVDGQPWLMFSFAQRKLILFGNALSWHDLPLLAGLMIAGACLLFFLAVAWGRVWCGFACPQSIWTWLFIRIEDLTEGRASVRARAENKAMNAERLLRRSAKHLLWIVLATLTALTFTGYFIPIRELVGSALQLEMGTGVAGWLVIMAGLTYANAGLVREKICLHACPYSRFQGVMFDRDTRTVSYDTARGEPRANRRNADANSGDCIDCGLCVQVCPTGIDIRDGLQAACIDCAACIDACDTVMSKLNRPTGLIRFASEAQLEHKHSPLLRPRLAGYAAVMLTACSAVVYGFTGTTDLLVEIRRDRGALFTQLDEHHICNNYRIKVEGFDLSDSLVRISVNGEGQFELFGPAEIDLNESNATWLPYRVCNQEGLPARTELTFHFEGTQVHASKETTFLAKTI